MNFLNKLDYKISFCCSFFITLFFTCSSIYLFIKYDRPIFRILFGIFFTGFSILIFIFFVTLNYINHNHNHNHNRDLNNINNNSNDNNINFNFNNNNRNDQNDDFDYINHNIDFSIIIKIESVNDLNNNFDTNCPLCLDAVNINNSYKLSNCNYHIFHYECLIKYLKNSFSKCPICNI